MKKILTGQAVREKILSAVQIMYNTVGITLTPKGRNVGLDKGFEKIAIRDGVSVAEQVELEDEFEDFAAKLVRQAAQHQVEKQGDGTTVTVILIHALVTECMRLISSGINAMELQEGLQKSLTMIVAHLEKMAKPIKTLTDKERIAIISSGEEELGLLIAKTIDKVGEDGVITVETSKNERTEVEHSEGMQFDRGWSNQLFITEPERLEATIEDPYIIFCDKQITNFTEFLPFTQRLYKVSRNIVIIAPDFSNEVMAAAIMTKIKGEMNVLLIRAPYFSELQKNFLKDLTALCGGMVVGDELGTAWENLDLQVCGRAKRITSTKDATTIVGGKGDNRVLEKHIEGIRTALETEESEFQREKLKERIAKLTNGVAVIKVGGHTDAEMKDRKERANDAVFATRSAIEGGIVPGGEIALLNLSRLADKEFPDFLSAKIIKSALRAPFKRLVENCGLDYAEVWQKLADTEINFGVDVADGEIKDMVEAGIIDPMLVVKSALENSFSIAEKLATTETLIVNEREKPKNT